MGISNFILLEREMDRALDGTEYYILPAAVVIFQESYLYAVHLV